MMPLRRRCSSPRLPDPRRANQHRAEGQSSLAERGQISVLLTRDSAVFEAPMPNVDAIATTLTTPTRQTLWRCARGAEIWGFVGLSGQVSASGLGLTGPCRSRRRGAKVLIQTVASGTGWLGRPGGDTPPGLIWGTHRSRRDGS